MAHIHATAVVEQGARIHDTAYIGPYCIVSGQAALGENVRLESHVVIAGDTELGQSTQVYPFASLGHAPQDLKFKGETSQLRIGSRNVIREHVTMNPGTAGGGLVTRVGDDCLFMVGAHVAHDCQLGNHVILANNATLGGHVHVGDHAIIGGLAAIHQFVRIGEHAMIGGMSGIESDVIPYGNAFGERAALQGLNLIGLKRRGFDRETIAALRKAFQELFDGQGTLASRVDALAEDYAHYPAIIRIAEFIREGADRALCRPRPALSGNAR